MTPVLMAQDLHQSIATEICKSGHSYAGCALLL